MLKNSSDGCWLSSRGVSFQWNNWEFEGRLLSPGSTLYNFRLYHNASYTGYKETGLRPIVTLNEDVIITKDTSHDGSTSTKACIIE